MQDIIKSFTRNTLGCNCPDKVFEQIDINQSPEQFQDLGCEALISIGGRLMVLLVSAEDGESLQTSLTDYFERGKQCRDERGFNRFRLTIACDNADSIRALMMEQFQGLDNIDDRLHLHVIKKSDVPQL